MAPTELLRKRWVALVFIALIVDITPTGALLAALSIDLGSQFMKIGLVKAVKFPKLAYSYLIDLLGKKLDNPIVQKFHKRFPQYKLAADHNRGTVRFEIDENESYSVEELIAMLLADARAVAEKFAEQPVKDVVLTVPPFFNQAERRAMVNAANIAGLTLLQLMNDNTAAGLNYGAFRRNQFNDTPTSILIYDMGATKTTATIFEYQMIKEKYEKNPQMTVLGIGYDRTLGGIDMTLRLRDHLLKLFRKQAKPKEDITENPRAMAKLFKEAERLKQVLSANADHVAQIEGLHEDIDFRSKVTRDEFENLCTDIYERVPQPVTDALKMAEFDIDQIGTLILMGGATRTPKVQEYLQKAVKGKELGKYLNTDEAISLGAVYQAAHLSKGFKVKKFLVKEATLFPITVDFHKETASEEESARIIHRNLFSYRNPYPQKKVMTFSKHTKDFEFSVNYGDLRHLTEVQRSEFGELNISRVDLGGVEQAIADTVEPEAQYRGVKTHFKLDESGIINIDSAEVWVEKVVVEEEGTLTKIGNKIRGFFGGDAKDEDGQVKDSKTDEPDKKPEEEKKEETEKTSEESKEEKKKEGDKKKETKEEEKEGDKKTEEDKKDKNDTKTDKKEEPPKPTVVKVPVNLEKAFMDMPNITEDELTESKSKLKSFREKEEAKAKHEAALNNLESFVFETKDKLEQEEYTLLTTQEERDSFMTKLNEAGEWLEETADPNTPTKELEDRLDELKTLTRAMFDRHKESIDRPRAIEALTQMFNYSQVFLSGMKNLSEEMQIFTTAEIELLEKTINETKAWFAEKSEAQAKLAGHEMAAMTVRDMAEKINLLDREVKYLLNKARTTKPKAPKVTVNGTDANATKTENETKSEKTKKGKQEAKEQIINLFDDLSEDDLRKQEEQQEKEAGEEEKEAGDSKEEAGDSKEKEAGDGEEKGEDDKKHEHDTGGEL